MTSDPGVTLGTVVTSYAVMMSYFFKVLHPILVNIRLQMFFPLLWTHHVSITDYALKRWTITELC